MHVSLSRALRRVELLIEVPRGTLSRFGLVCPLGLVPEVPYLRPSYMYEHPVEVSKVSFMYMYVACRGHTRAHHTPALPRSLVGSASPGR